MRTYKIINTQNNCFYVGSTSRTLSDRSSSHRTELSMGIHPCKALLADWRKYGVRAFVFVELDTFHTAEAMLAAEQVLLDKYHGTPGCYNVSKHPLYPMQGRHHTEETKALISKHRIGKAAGTSHYRYGQIVNSLTIQIPMLLWGLLIHLGSLKWQHLLDWAHG